MDSLLTKTEVIEIEKQFHEDLETWWENATQEERYNLTNSPQDLTSRNLKAQDTKTRKVIRGGLESMVKGLGYVIIRDKAWEDFWED